MRRVVAIAAAMAFALALSSCGGASNAATTTVPVLDGYAIVRGAYSLSAQFRFTDAGNGAPEKCDDVAARGTTRAGFVFGATAKASAQRALLFGVRAASYRGPARYEAVVTGLTVLDGPASVAFQPGPGSRAFVTTDVFAGGTALLDGLVTPDGRAVSVSLNWTCKTREVQKHPA